MAARFDRDPGAPAERHRVNSHPYYDSERHTFWTPCGRCGVRQSAEVCRDCREVDPEHYGDAMHARAWQRHLAARQRVIDKIEFHAWVSRTTHRVSA